MAFLSLCFPFGYDFTNNWVSNPSPVSMGGRVMNTIPASVMSVAKKLNSPNLSFKNMQARNATNIGYALHITDESPNGIYLSE